MSRWLGSLFALLGLALFVYVLQQTGWDVLWGEVRKLGAGWLLILLLSSVRYLSRAAAWLRCMPPAERAIGFWALWRARLAGEAVGDLTFGPVVAEPLRLIALGDRLATQTGISSLTVENVVYTVSSCLMVLAGAVLLLAQASLQESLRVAVFTALGVVLSLSVAAIFVIVRRWKVASQLAGWFVRTCVQAEVARRWLFEKVAQLSALEDYVFDFFAHRPRDFALVCCYETLFHLGGIAEIFVTMRLLGHELSLTTAFLLESLNRALNIAFIFVPALAGVDELGTSLVTEALGFGRAAGVALAIVRKLRMFFWIGIGLLLLLQLRQRRQPTTTPVPR